jgi:hypothetical protein
VAPATTTLITTFKERMYKVCRTCQNDKSTNLLLPKVFSIITDNSRVMLQIVVSLTDNYRGIIYHHNMFIVQATDIYSQNYYLKFDLKSILRSFCVNGNSFFKSSFSFFIFNLSSLHLGQTKKIRAFKKGSSHLADWGLSWRINSF